MESLFHSLQIFWEGIPVPFQINLIWLKMAGWAIAIFLFGIVFLTRVQLIRREDKILLSQKTAEIRQDSIRAQINYHFTFNSLNSIKGMILRNQHEAAVDYITKFGNLIRDVLENANWQFVPIRRELEVLQLYLDLEAVRTDNKFTYQIELGVDVNKEEMEMPAMLLQPFLENAIWHGIMPLEKEGHIQIQFNRRGEVLVVVIEDNGIGRAKAAELKAGNIYKRPSQGMKIIEERIQLLNQLHDEPFTLKVIDLEDRFGKATGTRVEVRIPLY